MRSNAATSALPLLILLATASLTAGCGSGSGHGKIVDPTPPVSQAVNADFSMSRTSGDVPTAVTFTNRSANATSFTWAFGDGTTSTEVSPTHSYAQPGIYRITLTAMNAKGETRSSEGRFVGSKVVTVPGATMGPYRPAHTVGDCDFAGHGPYVNVTAKVYAFGSSPARLYMHVYGKMAETQPDNSTCEGSGDFQFYAAPTGYAIAALPSMTTSSSNYVDTDHAYDNIGGSALAWFVVKGDTDGDDVCGSTSDDSHFYVVRSPMQIRLTPAGAMPAAATATKSGAPLNEHALDVLGGWAAPPEALAETPAVLTIGTAH